MSNFSDHHPATQFEESYCEELQERAAWFYWNARVFVERAIDGHYAFTDAAERHDFLSNVRAMQDNAAFYSAKARAALWELIG